MPDKQVSIIIPLYNRYELTRACLLGLKECAPGDLDRFDYEIIAVDNASSDATPEELPLLGANLFGARFTMLRHPENKNFSGACNAGAAKARGEKIFLLNNDTLASPRWFVPLWEAMARDETLGAAGPLLIYPDKRVQHLGIGFQVGGIKHLYQYLPSSHRVAARRRENLQGITAAAMLVDKKLFFDCGGFYEGYRNGFEDVELCLRIRERNRRMLCVPESVITHLESQTPGRNEHEAHNAALCVERTNHLFKPDTHIFALEDGYAVRLSDSLATFIELMEKDKTELAPLLERPSEETWRALLREPLWPEAYDPVCAWLERMGDLDEAMRLRFLEGRFYPNVHGLQAWARLATLKKDKETAQHAAGSARFVADKESNRPLMLKTAKKRLYQAMENKDELLENILREWFARRGLQI